MAEDDITKLPDEDSSSPIFDGRNQYYRIWMWCVAQAKDAAIRGEWDRWRRSIVSLYNHTQSFFTPEERKQIEDRVSKASTNLRFMRDYNRSNPAFRLAYYKHQDSFETNLNEAERLIYDAMRDKNMLLPRSAGDNGDFDIKSLLKESDLAS